MLEKELKKSIEMLNNSKKEMLDMNANVLEMTKNVTAKELEAIELELATPDLTEEQIAEIMERKNSALAELDKVEKEIAEDNIKLEEIGKDLEISEESKFNSIYEVIEYMTEISEKEENSIKKDKIITNIGLLKTTLSLEKLREFNPCRNNTFLRKNVDNINRDLQTIIAKDKRFVYPSCFQVKKAIKTILLEMRPELDEKELNRRSKEFTSFINLHLTKIDVKREGIYIYYILQNIYKIECLPIDKQFEYKERLLSILEEKLVKVK